MLGVGDSFADHVLQEDLEDAVCFLVDQAEDPLGTAAPGQAPVMPSRDSLVSKTAGAGFLTEFLEQFQLVQPEASIVST